MSVRTAKKPTTPVKVRAGRCGARFGRWRCDCDTYEFARRLDGWDTCVCRHTQAVHALIEQATP